MPIGVSNRCPVGPAAENEGDEEDRLGRRHHARAARNPLLASALRRPRAVRRLSPPLPPARGPAGPLLRTDERGRRRRPHHVRPLERVLRRPDREEAAQPLPPGYRSALVRDRRAATSPASSARTGTSPRRGRRTRWPTPRRPRSSRPRPNGSAAAASPSPTTTRSSSSSMRSTPRSPAGPGGSRRWP